MRPSALAVLGRGLVPVEAPVVRADDLGLLRGESLFETVRVARRRAFLLDAHLERMRAGAARLDVALPSDEQWHELVEQALTGWDDTDAAMRLVATKGPGPGQAGTAYSLVTPIPTATLQQRATGVDVVTLALGVPAALRPEAPWLLGGVKATSYAVAMAGLREAAARGAGDALWVSSDGEVLEAPTATVAWVTEGVLVTPPAEAVGILPGTTWLHVRQLAEAAGTPVAERRAAIDEVRAASEVMLLSSVRGVTGVLTIDGARVGAGEVGPLTTTLSEALERAALGD